VAFTGTQALTVIPCVIGGRESRWATFRRSKPAPNDHLEPIATAGMGGPAGLRPPNAATRTRDRRTRA
jgi:hypothetical protein